MPPPTPVVPAAVIPCLSRSESCATCISGKSIGLSAICLAISINSILRSSIPGASLTIDVDVDGVVGAVGLPPPKKLILYPFL